MLCYDLYFDRINLQSFCQPVQNAPLYYANNLNHLIKHTRTHTDAHTYTQFPWKQDPGPFMTGCLPKTTENGLSSHAKMGDKSFG